MGNGQRSSGFRPSASATPPEARPGLLGAALLALVVALACRGHYARPHADFFEFVDNGHALLSGQLPGSLKRGPVYPLLIVGISKLVPGEAPEKAVAEWINVVLLPVLAGLAAVTGWRWAGRNGWIGAVWLCLLPLTLHATADLLAELLLATLMLATVVAAARGGPAAYALAALAVMTRFDAAGLLAGVAVVDWLRGARWRAIMIRTGLATLPALIWLGLTALTWSERSQDHYVARMLEQPAFRPWHALDLIAAAAADPGLFERATFGMLPPGRLREWLVAAVWALALLGAARLVRERRGDAVVALVALLVYVAAWSLVPFSQPRYGFPVAPPLVVLVVAGVAIVLEWSRRHTGLQGGGRAAAWVGGTTLAIAGAYLLMLLLEAGEVLASWTPASATLAGRALLPALTAAAVAAALVLAGPGRRAVAAVGVLALVTLVVVQVQRGARELGSGRERLAEVEAARWIRDNVEPDARVLSPLPGLLRLYAGREPAGRFVGLGEIDGASWPEVLAVCRAGNVRYLVWHDEVFTDHSGHYARLWRLERFEALTRPELRAGLRLVRSWPGGARVRIYRVEAGILDELRSGGHVMNMPIKRGMLIRYQGHLYTVAEYNERHSGKMKPTVHVLLRDVRDGHSVDRSLDELMPIQEVPCGYKQVQYLYAKGTERVFMESETFEELALSPTQISGAEPFLREGESYRVLYADGQPLMLELPEIVPLKVGLTAAPSHAGSPGGNVYKEATLENGLEIKVPLFIKSGDVVRVDTRTRTYVGKEAS